MKLPDYLIPINPLKMKAYADIFRTQLVLSDIKDDNEAYNQMRPGFLTLDSIIPSDDKAYTQNVAYTILFTPSHTSHKDTRIIIDMPKHLVFQEGQNCTAEVLVANCTIDAKINRVLLTNGFKSDYKGNQQLKVVISIGTNPQGSRDAGPWGVYTEQLFFGIYYTVDGETSPTSFFAQPGWIRSNLTYNMLTTYSPFNLNLVFDL